MTTNVVDIGEKIVKEVFGANERQRPKISTSQIRKFLSAVNAIQNKVSVIEGDQIPEDLTNEIQYLRIKLAYQAGRDNTRVQRGEKKPLELLKEVLDTRIKNIGNSKKEFNEFATLMESIVAYHKFYGGKD